MTLRWQQGHFGSPGAKQKINPGWTPRRRWDPQHGAGVRIPTSPPACPPRTTCQPLPWGSPMLQNHCGEGGRRGKTTPALPSIKTRISQNTSGSQTPLSSRKYDAKSHKLECITFKRAKEKPGTSGLSRLSPVGRMSPAPGRGHGSPPTLLLQRQTQHRTSPPPALLPPSTLPARPTRKEERGKKKINIKGEKNLKAGALLTPFPPPHSETQTPAGLKHPPL